MPFEMDRPLQFHGDSEIVKIGISPRNTTTIGVQSSIYDAARKVDAGCSCKNMHHQKAWKPCIDITEEYILEHKDV